MDELNLDHILESLSQRNVYAYGSPFLIRDDLYDLGKIEASISREFYQANCRIEGFLRRGVRLTNEDERKETGHRGIVGRVEKQGG